jgi:hypothetical protein
MQKLGYSYSIYTKKENGSADFYAGMNYKISSTSVQ